jgi:hypothetical protein
VQRALLGVSIQEISQDLADAQGLKDLTWIIYLNSGILINF